MSRRRRLSPEEERLWKRVADTASPMHKSHKRTFEPETPPARPAYKPPEFRIGDRAAATETRITAPDTPLRMDRKAFVRMRRGKTIPDARIDLHGMTAAAAHTALTSFLLRAHADGKRLVLVITGKGRPETGGILRRELPHWLQLPPLGQIVLQTTEAHRRHGGSGAFYVYLRRPA
jgi:DNA-nicking Smr family endonuclease